jgi:porin
VEHLSGWRSGGRGVIPGRSLDRYGLGFYALFVSDDLKNRPILGQLETEWGMEAFYNLALTPWLQLTGDLQYIVTGFSRVDNAVVLGTRIQMYS